MSDSPEFASASPDPYKQAIAQAFGQASHSYAQQASAQQASVQRLLEFFDRCLADRCLTQTQAPGSQPPGTQPHAIPTGPILEIGCGTGFLTRSLIEKFSSRHPLEITDLSTAMVAECQQQIAPASSSVSAPPAQIAFYALDGEAVPAEAGPYALIVSNFAVQWFRQPRSSLSKLQTLLKPGGWLLVAFPSCHSFPQWRSHCEALALPFPAQHLPEPELGQALVREASTAIANPIGFYETHNLPLAFDNALAFLRHFKTIGAANPLARNAAQSAPRPTPRQIRQLIHHWDQQSPDGIRDHYHAVYIAIQS